MDITSLPQLVRNTGRLNEVVQVLVRYGLAPWLKSVPVDWLQRLFRTEAGQPISDLDFHQRVRLALTELGPTYIKVGQVLSTRPDIVGPELAEELAKLQKETPPDPPETVAALVRKEFGKSPAEMFASFDGEAFASASIGQVHFAELHDGTPVVVKIQHEGIEDRVRNDLEILIELARIAEKYAPQLRPYRPEATAKELRKTIEGELDFTREMSNLRRFARNFSDDPTVRFPAPYSDFSSRRVLTMDRLNGICLSNRKALVAAGYDLFRLARRGADIFVEMVFRDGFYHADPHPGNLMVLEGQVIGVMDCGMVGRVDDDLREQIEDVLLSALDLDTDAMLDGVVHLGQVPPDFDADELKSELVHFVDEYASRTISEFDLSGAMNEMVEIIRRHHIILPARVALLIKTLVILEGTARKLNPEFSLAEVLESHRSEAIRRRLSPARLWRKVQVAHRDWTRLIESFPRDFADIIERVRRGSFDVHLDHRRLDTIVNRLVLGILTAALFVGSASLWSANVRPLIGGVSVPGAAGCGVAVYLGFTLLRAIRRSGNIIDPR